MFVPTDVRELLIDCNDVRVFVNKLRNRFRFDHILASLTSSALKQKRSRDMRPYSINKYVVKIKSEHDRDKHHDHGLKIKMMINL